MMLAQALAEEASMYSPRYILEAAALHKALHHQGFIPC
jgi:hypothetical protein